MIKDKYILFTRIPIFRNANGDIYCDRLWAKDLKLHLDYIEDLGLCCPVVNRNETEGLINITPYGIGEIFELRLDQGLISVIKNLLPNFFVVARACKATKIVHSDCAGWAFPLSFYILLIRPFITFRWIIVVESSFWMLRNNEKRTPRKIIEHYGHKLLLKSCLKIANARIFTQSFYRGYFLGKDRDHTMINPATWVDNENITTPKELEKRRIARKGKATTFIYPTRLEEEKGVRVVFAAIEKLKEMGTQASITIIGSGNLQEECKNFATKDHGTVKVEYRKPVEYGAELFGLLSQYDFALVPNLSEEQPRIIFDVFSQGLPVIGSDTSGILDITNSENALTFRTGDPSDLAKAIHHAVNNPDIAYEMGLSALRYVSGKTHVQMHKDRKDFLEKAILA